MTIIRLNKSDDESTVSEVYLDDKFVYFSIEQPWNNNIPYKSCIPTGTYNLKPYNSFKHGETYCFWNPNIGVTKYQDNSIENNRFACLSHVANWAHQLEGCVAYGDDLIKDNQDRFMVTNSAETFKKWLSSVDEKTVVTIKNEGDWE